MSFGVCLCLYRFFCQRVCSIFDPKDSLFFEFYSSLFLGHLSNGENILHVLKKTGFSDVPVLSTVVVENDIIRSSNYGRGKHTSTVQEQVHCTPYTVFTMLALYGW